MALSEYLEQLAQVFWPGRYIKIGTHFSNPWQHARVEHMHKDSGVLQIRYSEDMRQDHLILTEDYKRIHIDLRECSPHQYPPGIRVRFRPSPTTTLEGTLISATKEEFTVYRNPVTELSFESFLPSLNPFELESRIIAF
jgi:hypothetical protein